MNMNEQVQGIGDFVMEAYADYGKYVNTNRHVPEVTDGLKPVYKRLILSALETATDLKKTQTVIGYCAGKYHPHGVDSLKEVVAELVRANIFVGKGSFGYPGMFKWSDFKSAATRYTEVKLNPEFRKSVSALLPYVPKFLNDLDTMESEYIPTPYPICLNLGNFGIGVGMVVNTPAFDAKSIVKAGYAAICNQPEPWKLLQPRCDLIMSDRDKSVFWHNYRGTLTYQFKVSTGISGGLNGWYISGDPSFVKPRFGKLFKAKDNDGRVVIRDESAKGIYKVFVARSKRIKTISDSEVESMVYEASEIRKYFSLYAVVDGQSRPITGGDWIQRCLWNYSELVKKYKQDSLNKLKLEIEAYTHLPEVANRIINTSDTYPKIKKELGLSDGVVEKIANMTISVMRTVDCKKKLKTLNKEVEHYTNLKVKDMLSDYLN